MKYVTQTLVKKCFPRRKKTAHKGDAGRVLIVAGSVDYPGAAYLTALGVMSLRTGTDLVVIACPEKVALAINSLSPDLITLKIKGEYLTAKHVKELSSFSKKFDCVVIGPGISLKSESFAKAFCEKVSIPKVIDADALKAIDPKKVKNTIFTPHKTELEIMLKKKDLTTPEKKIEAVKEYHKKSKNKNVFLCKGNPDVIVSESEVLLNKTGNPGMAVGGTGDVLAGLVAGIVAQGNDLFESACAAAYLNGKTGDGLQKKLGNGFLASEVGKELSITIKKLTS